MSSISDLIGTLTDNELALERALIDVRSAIKALATLEHNQVGTVRHGQIRGAYPHPSVREVVIKSLSKSPGMTTRELVQAIASAQGADTRKAQIRAGWLYSRHGKGIIERRDGRWYLVAPPACPEPAEAIA